MTEWLKKLPWKRIGLVAAGSAVVAAGAVFPVVAPATSLIGPGLIGMALPSEWAGKVAGAIGALGRKK